MSSSRWISRSLCVLVALVAGACGDDTDVDEPEGIGAIAERGGAPDVVWSGTTGTGARVHAWLFDSGATDSSGQSVEVVIDNRDGETDEPVGEIEIESRFENDGDLEIFPVVERFVEPCQRDDAVDCSPHAVAQGAVASFELVGSWPSTEPVVRVQWVTGAEGPGVSLRAAFAAEVDIPDADYGTTVTTGTVPEGTGSDGPDESASIDLDTLTRYLDARTPGGLPDAASRVGELEADCVDPAGLRTAVEDAADVDASIPVALAEHAFVCPALVLGLQVPVDGREDAFATDLDGLRVHAEITNPRVLADDDRFARFVVRLRENCTRPGQFLRTLTAGGDPAGPLIGWHAFVCPEVVMSATSLPRPEVAHVGQEQSSGRSSDFVAHQLSVSNADAYADALFEPSPSLPPCGRNEDAARTWADIVRADTLVRVYGYCALGGAEDLRELSFSVPVGEAPPPAVVVQLIDRATGATVTSDPVAVPAS